MTTTTIIKIPDECPICHAWSPAFLGGDGCDGCCWLECRCGSYSPLAENWGEAYALWVKNPQFFPSKRHRLEFGMDIFIAIDFDGTIVEHRYPHIGNLVPHALRVLQRLVDNPVNKLILYTMRSGKELNEAVEFCKLNGINFWGVNENPLQKPWTTSPKVYAHVYIDDVALGCPLQSSQSSQSRPYVDWLEVENLLSLKGIL